MLSVVIPVYNEVENIEPLLRETLAATSGWEDAEVIFVDDGSTDGTGERIAALASEHSAVRLVRHRSNAGQSAAILSGVRAARFDWIVTLDGDGQNDPEDILTLVGTRDAAANTPTLVAGVRRGRRDTWLRRMSSRAANAVRRRILRDGATDTGCGLKLFRRDCFLGLPRFDHMHRFLPALFQRDGGSVLTVAVRHRARLRGTSKYGVRNRLWVGVVDLLGVVWLQRRAGVNAQIEDHHVGAIDPVAGCRVPGASPVLTPLSGAVDSQ